MKQTEKFAVLRSKRAEAYVTKYESKEGTFAYSVGYTNDLRHAAKTELEAIENQKEEFVKLENALDCEILVVEAEYTLKTLDGNEPEALTKQIEVAKKESFKKFFEILTEASEED